MQKIAIYARKSVFREDSISIESQIDICAYEARGEEYVVYQDNGFSGKNTDRPAFKQMMSSVKARRISKVIVYKLDRISRSILDFSEMMEVFQKHKVDFISATEHFDTSSPMGRAMLNICIVFAQLERETIQQRVADAYVSRSKKGFYMGGRIPYGFCKIPTAIDGIKTSMYEILPEEAADIQKMYELYSRPSATIGDVLREFAEEGIKHKRGKNWNTSRISELMRNPAYVKADINIYNFFKHQESNLCSPPEMFDGNHGCYLFTGENTNRKTWDLKGQNIVIAPHRGFIDSDVWIACRKKLLSNHQIKNCKPKSSWLAGKVKCGACGYAMAVKRAKTQAGRYFVCSGRTSKVCNTDFKTIYADEFEEEIRNKISEKIKTLTVHSEEKNIDNSLKINACLQEIAKLEESINIYLDKMLDADTVTRAYITKRINEYDSRKKEIMREIDELEEKSEQVNYKVYENVMSVWDKLSFDDKRNVVDLLITKIVVYPDRYEIVWKV